MFARRPGSVNEEKISFFFVQCEFTKNQKTNAVNTEIRPDSSMNVVIHLMGFNLNFDLSFLLASFRSYDHEKMQFSLKIAL